MKTAKICSSNYHCPLIIFICFSRSAPPMQTTNGRFYRFCLLSFFYAHPRTLFDLIILMGPAGNDSFCSLPTNEVHHFHRVFFLFQHKSPFFKKNFSCRKCFFDRLLVRLSGTCCSLFLVTNHHHHHHHRSFVRS